VYVAGRGAEILEGTNGNRKRGMVLPFQPLAITFDEIRYSVDMPVVWKYLHKTLEIMEALFIFFLFKYQVKVNLNWFSSGNEGSRCD